MWRAEVTHDNDCHCEFRTGIRPTLMDETSHICRPRPSWLGLSQGLSRPSTSSNGAAVSYTVGALPSKKG